MRCGVAECFHLSVTLKQRPCNVRIASPVEILTHGAGDTVPGLIRIAAGELTQEMRIRATLLNARIVAFPIFIGPVKNESAHTDLINFSGAVVCNYIPFCVL